MAIVGGGPAGAQCARSLAAHGVRVTLFEPRRAFEKACGGGVPARALEHYPFLSDPRLPVRLVRNCLLVAPSGREAVFDLRDPLWVFSRADLHSFLIDRATAAGATLVAERVVGFDRTASSWSLRTSPDGGPPARRGPFDFLVAADGAGGFCRRRLTGRAARPTEVSQAIGHYLPGHTEDRIVLRFFEKLHGYLWVFPRIDHASAGICATLGSRPVDDLRELLETDLKSRYGAGVLTASRPYAALIPAAPAVTDDATLQGDGWALAGDAGRFVDPITREGIDHAMRSGDLLAGALVAGRPGDYAALWARDGARELAWASGHSGGFFSTPFLERLVRLCGASPSIARVMSDLIAGRQPYRTLKTRLILKTARVGWEILARSHGRPRRARAGTPVNRVRDS